MTLDTTPSLAYCSKVVQIWSANGKMSGQNLNNLKVTGTSTVSIVHIVQTTYYLENHKIKTAYERQVGAFRMRQSYEFFNRRGVRQTKLTQRRRRAIRVLFLLRREVALGFERATCTGMCRRRTRTQITRTRAAERFARKFRHLHFNPYNAHIPSNNLKYFNCYSML